MLLCINDYMNGIKRRKEELSKDRKFLESGEFISIVRLQERCIEKGISVEIFLKINEVILETMNEKHHPLFFPDISRAVEVIRREKDMSMRALIRRMDSDRGNLYRLLRKRAETQRSCALSFVVRLAFALGVYPSYIFEVARRIKNNTYK